MTFRERLGSWLLGASKSERAAPIDFSPGNIGSYYGVGIDTNQAGHDTLLKENVGVSDIATRAIANRIGSLNPLVKVSRRTEIGTLEDEILDDHVLKALLDRPHPDFTRRQLLRLTSQYIVSVGEAYWLKVGNALGMPAQLQPMPPQHVYPVVRGGIIDRYKVVDGEGREHILEAGEVVRFWFPDPETLYTAEGYLGPNAVNTDAARFASEHLRARYQNDSIPPVLLKAGENAAPPNDAQWTRWQHDFQRKYHWRHGQKQGLPAMLPTGWDAVVLALSTGADITPLLEYWQSNQLMNFGVPASVLGRVVSGDRSSAETNQYVFDLHTIKPISDMIAEALTLQLAPQFDASLWVEFEPFVSEDKEFDLQRERQDLETKVRSPAQILRDRGSDPEDAPWGELPVGTLAEAPYAGEPIDLEMPAEGEGDLFEPEEDAEDEAPRELPSVRWKRARAHFAPAAEYARVLARERKWRPKFERAVRGVVEAQRRETVKRLRAALPADRARAPVDLEALFDPADWARLFELRVEPIRKAAYVEAAAEALAGIVDDVFEFTPTVAQILRDQGADLVTKTGETTRRKLRRALVASTEEGESVDALTKRINTVFAGRRRNARTIARTELLKATQNAQVEGYRQSKVVERKQWNDNRDPEVRPSHVGSAIRIVPIEEPFVLADGVTEAMYPGDSNLPVGEVANCRCFVTPVFDDDDEAPV